MSNREMYHIIKRKKTYTIKPAPWSTIPRPPETRQGREKKRVQRVRVCALHIIPKFQTLVCEKSNRYRMLVEMLVGAELGGKPPCKT